VFHKEKTRLRFVSDGREVGFLGPVGNVVASRHTEDALVLSWVGRILRSVFNETELPG
jgi:hypothetical protein